MSSASGTANIAPDTAETNGEFVTGASSATIAKQTGATARRSNRTATHFLMFIAVLFVFATNALRWSRAGEDPDLWWHVRTGGWILQHGALPTTDPFSFGAAGKPWIVYHWLFSVVLSRVFDSFGLQGVVAFVTGLTLVTMLALTALLTRYTTVVRAMILAGTVQVAMFSLRGPRPWLFSILFFIIELWLLLQACERNKPIWLVPLFPLFALWANLHVEFVFGLGLMGLFALQQSLPALPQWTRNAGTRLSAAWLWAAVVMSMAATLLNPYGWRVYDVVMQYSTQAAPFQFVQEMQPMNFRGFTDWAALLLVCWASFALGRTRNRPAVMVALLIVSCWFGFRAAREIWFPAIASALIIAYTGNQQETESKKLPRAYWAIAFAAVLLFSFAGLGTFGRSEADLWKSAGEHFPVEASAYIERNHLSGPLYNSYGWGGYLIWRLPELRVSIDGRANLHGDERVTRSARTTFGSNDWAEDRELLKSKTIVLEDDSPLASILRSDARFRLLYRDKVASVFQPAR